MTPIEVVDMYDIHTKQKQDKYASTAYIGDLDIYEQRMIQK
jgi:hypothetical protein